MNHLKEFRRRTCASHYYKSLVTQDRLKGPEQKIKQKQGVFCSTHSDVLRDIAWILTQKYKIDMTERSSARWVISDDKQANICVPNADSIEAQIDYIREIIKEDLP